MLILEEKKIGIEWNQICKSTEEYIDYLPSQREEDFFSLALM